MRTLVVIPARLAAVRLPRKPLRLLAGIPLVTRVYQRVSEMSVGERVVIATEDPAVREIAEEAGAECVMTSAAHSSGTERVAEVASMSEFTGFDVIVNVQGDEPFIGRASVSGAAELVKAGRFPIGTSAAAAPWDIGGKPGVVKVVVGDAGQALYFSRAGIPHLRDGAPPEDSQLRMLQHIGVYAYRRSALQKWVSLPPHPLEVAEKLEQLRPLAASIPIGVAIADEQAASGIDTEDDLAAANERWHEFIAGR